MTDKNIFPFYTQQPAGPRADFRMETPFKPSGDQPKAIESLIKGIESHERNQVLLGVTGSGKTFTMAKTIEAMGRPTVIMAPNKTLAAQLYSEMKEFFPHNHVEYFVSYYDYYQPEAYVAKTDTYIEKDASINDQIDRMRHGATRSLLEHRDVIIVASVSCLYGLGDPESYADMRAVIKSGEEVSIEHITKLLVNLQYTRNDMDFKRGTFRVKGDVLEIFPPHNESRAWRLSFFGDEIESITEVDSLTGEKTFTFEQITVYPNSHHITPRPALSQAMVQIKEDLKTRLAEFEADKKFLEHQRLKERVQFDLEMMASTGSCKGIENYSRYLTGRNPGEPPPTLFEYLPEDALLFIDESHVAVPQINGMYRGDRARKVNLTDYGFRLPAAKDNRPLKFEEWEIMRPQTIFVSATPGDWELEQTDGKFTEQIIRPTGLLDPVTIIRPAESQVDNLMHEAKEVVANNGRILCTTLTKKMAEQLTDYLNENGMRAKYMHSDIDTLERIEIIRALRLGEFDVLVGINLLREGLDIPECKLVAILDADKEGFLRSERSLIQTIGRAARNAESRVILYADKMTRSIEAALSETQRRRKIQESYNTAHGITPQTIIKNITNHLYKETDVAHRDIKELADMPHFENEKALKKELKRLEKEMLAMAENLEFEKAADIRDQIKKLEKQALDI